MSVLTPLTPWAIDRGGCNAGRALSRASGGSDGALRHHCRGSFHPRRALGCCARPIAMAIGRPSLSASATGSLRTREPGGGGRSPFGAPNTLYRLRRRARTGRGTSNGRWGGRPAPVERLSELAPSACADDACKGLIADAIKLPPASPAGWSCGLGGLHPPVSPAL